MTSRFRASVVRWLRQAWADLNYDVYEDPNVSDETKRYIRMYEGDCR